MTYDIRKMLLAVAALALLTLLEKAISIRRKRRERQIALPFIAVIFGCVCPVLIIKFGNYVNLLIVLHIYLTDADIILINLAILLTFILVKAMLSPILSLIWKNNKITNKTSSKYYEYCEDYNLWFLKKKMVNFRALMKVLWICGTLVFGCFLGCTWMLGPSSPCWIYVYPTIVLIVINELFCFINGTTREEFSSKILGEDDSAHRINRFYKIREIFERMLPKPLLASYTGCEFIDRNGPEDILSELEASEDDLDRATAKYFRLYGKKEFPDTDYIQATLRLMHRKNVVIYNPFYRDLSLYITLPLVNSLIHGKKCLVISSRKAAGEDIKEWITDIIKEYSCISELWRVADLSNFDPDCEIGIMNYSQMYDINVIKANDDFFHATDFVLLLEPSLSVNTAQVAQSIISEEISLGGKPVYCICDRNADGLVDIMSHLIRDEIAEVTAPPVPRCIYTGITWAAEGDYLRQQLFDKQTRYLGNGIELSAIAIKNQIPVITWISETKAPIRDIRWIAGQYNSTLCKYMNLPIQQKSLYEKLQFVTNIWGVPVAPERFLIVEDEFCNMFTTLRTFVTRGRDQVFANVLCENYLLRDYMRCNWSMFSSNPNAIPSLTPDYAKTERNTILKLIILMVCRPVTEYEIINELNLLGYDSDDALGVLTRLLHKYTFADDSVFSTCKSSSSYYSSTVKNANCFFVSESAFSRWFSDSLKNAYYIVEEEKQNEEYLDAKMFNHIAQTILPGQFVTYNGKYYMAKYVSPTSGVVLRRASDLYTGRVYYRQIRTYILDSGVNFEISRVRKITDIEVALIRTDIFVETTGYLEMNDAHDLRMAKTIDFSEDPSVGNYKRKYRNKNILRLKLPDTDVNIKYSVCMLLSEIVHSVFPSVWQYIAVVSKRPDNIEGMLNYLVYDVRGDVEDDYIYIIEDSDIDLGLLDAIERNLMRLFEIITDYLDWHFMKMREPAQKDPVPGNVDLPKDNRNMLVRMFDRIRRLFGGKKEKDLTLKPEKDKKKKKKESPETDKAEKPDQREYTLNEAENTDEQKQTVTPDADYQTGSEASEEYTLDAESDSETKEKIPDSASSQNVDNANTQKTTNAADAEPEDTLRLDPKEDASIVHIDGTDIFDDENASEFDDMFEQVFEAEGIKPIEKTRYQKDCYLKFGFEEIDGRIHIDDVRNYFRLRGWSDNALTKARSGNAFIPGGLDTDIENCCDFCMLPLGDISYEKLDDGRIRCNDCAASAITTVEEFRALFYKTKELMEGSFSIQFKIPISVKTADARTGAREAGGIFKPSKEFAARTLGFAQYQSGRYSIVIENGSPRRATIDTMTHELTHIWQYLNWDDKTMHKLYRDKTVRLMVYEGMAVWAAVQYMYQIGETYYASKMEALYDAREDVYGLGFSYYRTKYPLVKDTSALRFSPFSTFPPL